MATLNLKNNIIIVCFIFFSCNTIDDQNYLLKDDFSIMISGYKEVEILKSDFYIKRNGIKVDSGKLIIQNKLNRNDYQVIFDIPKLDTIKINDTIYLNFPKKVYIITNSCRRRVETKQGNPYIKEFKIDGIIYDSNLGLIKK